MGASNYVHLEVSEIKRETDRAFLVVLEDGSEYWLPKSQIADADQYEEGDANCTISITEWLAGEKGIG